MTQRNALVIGTALAAISVAVLGLLAFSMTLGSQSILSRYAGELVVLAIMPTTIAAALSCAWVARFESFQRRGHLANAVLISLMSYPILFFVLLLTIFGWLQFERYLPLYERPDSLSRMASTAFGYTRLALMVGVLPAIVVEYFVVRFVRKRWSSTLSSGVVS
jgi:hypothetical protein